MDKDRRVDHPLKKFSDYDLMKIRSDRTATKTSRETAKKILRERHESNRR